MSYQQTIAEDRRLSELLILSASPGYTANTFLLRDGIDRVYGHNASADQVNTDVAWLQEQGLVTTRSVSEVTLATITARGLDVSTGRATQPGVKRPSPV